MPDDWVPIQSAITNLSSRSSENFWGMTRIILMRSFRMISILLSCSNSIQENAVKLPYRFICSVDPGSPRRVCT
jgi:hypothetical protein